MPGRTPRLRSLAATAGLAAVTSLVSACGGSIHDRGQATVVHLDGRVTGDYVRETSATGTGFLVPTGVLAAQGSRSFDISAPPVSNSSTTVVGPRFTFTTQARAQRWEKTWFVGPSISGTTPQGAHVELLVTGDPGRRIYLSFEESCGFVHVGPTRQSESALKGADAQRVLHTPAVMMVPALRSRPENRCYVSGVVVTRGRNHLHISLIDY